jgi:hypothetical protein
MHCKPRFLLASLLAVALYSCGGGGGGSSPSVTATPHLPAAAPVVSPTALAFDGTGASLSQTVTVTEANYSGTFTAASENTSVASVSPATSGATFTLTPIGGGTTSVAIEDSYGQTVSVSVGVTASIIQPQGHR